MIRDARRCDYCYRVSVATLTARRNTFWRTVLHLPRPTWHVCHEHLAARRWGSW